MSTAGLNLLVGLLRSPWLSSERKYCSVCSVALVQIFECAQAAAWARDGRRGEVDERGPGVVCQGLTAWPTAKVPGFQSAFSSILVVDWPCISKTKYGWSWPWHATKSITTLNAKASNNSGAYFRCRRHPTPMYWQTASIGTWSTRAPDGNGCGG